MQNHSTIFILYSCNQWKEYSSMNSIVASTNMDDIYKEIKKEIRLGNMNYEKATKRAGIKLFNEDLKNNRVNLDLLDYGYIEELKNMAAVSQRRNSKKGDYLYV